jgi:predicted phage baseplate assembly protein
LSAEGGTDPESADAARLSMPLGTRTLGRAVSLLDYEDFARAYSGIDKAQAQVLNLRGGKTIAITLAAPSGLPLTPASPVWTHLLAALKASGDPHVAVQLLSLQASTFHVGLRVKCDPACEAAQVLSAVRAALRAAFSFDARALGQPVQQSEVIAAAQAVPGVLALDLTHLYGGSAPASQAVHNGTPNVRLLARRMNATGGVAQPAELLTLDPGPFDLLEALP